MRAATIMCMLTAAALGCSSSSPTKPSGVSVVDADVDTDADGDADSDSDADGDTDADTDTASMGSTSDSTSLGGTGDTAVPSCTPERLVVTTPGVVANPGISGFAQFSMCVDPAAGTLHAVKQLWYGDIENTVLCMYTWETESTNVVYDCEDCDWAFDFNWEVPIEDGTTMCTEGWWHPAELYSPINARIGFAASHYGAPDVYWDLDADGEWESDYDTYHGAKWPIGSDISAEYDGREWRVTYKYSLIE